MNEIENKLDDFFENWKDDKNSRYLSWEHCYSFFKENKNKVLSDETMQDMAFLHLAFYLASWGMYRGSSNLLWKDYKVHKDLITELLSKCSNLYNKKISWDELKNANEIIKKHCKNYNIKPTDTLITKILMGIFGCIPAYDRFFIEGLKKYNKNHDVIQQTYNEQSFEQLQKIAENLKYKNNTRNYPVMKLLDTYFWWTGGGKEAHQKRAK